jgi:hypothetical protein
LRQGALTPRPSNVCYPPAETMMNACGHRRLLVHGRNEY